MAPLTLPLSYLGIILASCSLSSSTFASQVFDGNMPALPRSHSTAFRLYSELVASRGGENVVFSPYSIFSVVHMVQKGADGKTKEEIDEIVAPEEFFNIPPLRQPRDANNEVVVESVNKIYAYKDLLDNDAFKAYQDSLQVENESYQVEAIDFADSAAAAEKINADVAQATRQKIVDLVDAGLLDEDTRLLLANALYLKAPWMSQFDEEDTFPAVFNALDASGQVHEQLVNFMRGSLSKGPTIYFEEDGVKVVGVPYSDPRLGMYLIVPRDFGAFEEGVRAEPSAVMELLRKADAAIGENSLVELELSLPKFHLRAEDNAFDLVPVFEALGASSMFDMATADFSKISGSRDLVVSAFLHQADLNADEKGTEAAAATAAAIMLRSAPLPRTPVEVVINKPFMFVLKFKAGEEEQLLFVGRVVTVQGDAEQ